MAEPLTMLGLAANVIATKDWIELSDESLHVLDISFLPNVVSKLLGTTQGPNNTVREVVDVLDSLPPHNPHFCRLYIENGLRGHQEFMYDVEKLVSGDWVSFYRTTTKSAFNRRLENGQMPWWLSSMYTFGHSDLAIGLFGGLIRTRMKVRCVWHDDNRMSCKNRTGLLLLTISLLTENEGFVSGISDIPNYSGESKPTLPQNPLGSQLAISIIELYSSYEKNKSNVDTDTMQQRIVILRLCHAAFYNHIRSLRIIERRHNTFLQHLSDPGRTTITPSFLQEISKDSYFWEHIQHNTDIFAGAIESLLAACHLNSDLPNVQEFRELLIEVQGICTEVRQRSDSISKRLEGRLKFIEIGQNYYETSGLRLLSLLAIIFLPLSLASSLLSMQTRFVDLHYLLYDFFGVIVLLGTITAAIVVFLKCASWRSETLNTRVTHEKALKAIRGGITFMIIIPWTLILSSFLVGMLKDVGLGLKILGFRFAVVGGFLLLFALGGGLLYFLYTSL